MILGTVISTQDTPTTENFHFVVKGKVEVGQFIQTQNPQVVAFVSSITKQNRYFQFAETISQYDSAAVSDVFPSQEWEYTIAKCKVIGVFDGGVGKCVYPVSPGVHVFEATVDAIKAAIGLDEKGISIGEILGKKDVKAQVNFSRLLQKHLAILGISGSGKSHAVSVVIEEILNRKKEEGRLAVIAIDPHGDYAGFSNCKEFADKTLVLDASKVTIAASALNATLLSELVPSTTVAAKRDYTKIHAAVKEQCKTEERPPTIDDYINAAASSRSNVAEILDEIKAIGLFGLVNYPALESEVKPGKLLVLDMQNVESLKARQAIVAIYAKRLFSARRDGKVPPFLLLIEEAHNFCREKVAKEGAISKGIIETIAREGRKFGASLCLVSQRPVQLSTTALSQCNSMLIMRVTNPYDVDHIANSSEGIDRDAMNRITSLSVGQGILIGEAINQPTFVKIRKRATPSTGGKSLEELAQTYENSKPEKNKDDISAFL